MRTFDLNPLFRNTVGFDRMARMLDTMSSETPVSYPPYNIEKLSDTDYAITMAVAGFSAEDLEISVQENQLTIAGSIENNKYKSGNEDAADDPRIFLYRGIAERSFERRFSLADHIKIVSARMENGLLHVLMHREVPEAAKPRLIPIEVSETQSFKLNKTAKVVAGKLREVQS